MLSSSRQSFSARESNCKEAPEHLDGVARFIERGAAALYHAGDAYDADQGARKSSASSLAAKPLATNLTREFRLIQSGAVLSGQLMKP